VYSLYVGDNVDVLKREVFDGSVQLTVTSPPYDNLRKYNGFSWDFEASARELYRVTKPGGVVVWVIGDATVDGSETGTSFRQALYFKSLGFNLHDTMIWEKTGRLPTQDRYYNIFEYMFVFSKGKPSTMNFICDAPTTSGGRVQKKDSVINKGAHKEGTGTFVRNFLARRPNIWKINIGSNPTGHPAPFPEALAQDHILTWSNPGDLVLDPFVGSGTTGKMALLNSRRFIGIDISPEYVDLADCRIKGAQQPVSMTPPTYVNSEPSLEQSCQ
jgi:DNA modification methylase